MATPNPVFVAFTISTFVGSPVSTFVFFWSDLTASVVITHICGFPAFHNWGNAGTRILPGAAAFKGGYDISR